MQLANAFSAETQKRQAAANAAQVQAEQTGHLAGVRASEVAALENERAAILQLDEGYRNSTPEVQMRWTRSSRA